MIDRDTLLRGLDLQRREDAEKKVKTMTKEERKELFSQWREIFQDAHNAGIKTIRISTSSGDLYMAFLLESESTTEGDFDYKRGKALCVYGEFAVEHRNDDIWVAQDLKAAIELSEAIA